MNRAQHRVNNEEGFVLVVALMILVILSLIGIAGLNTSIFEKQIAGNDWNSKLTFYSADSGVEVGQELIEQSISCPGGFGQNFNTDALLGPNPPNQGTVYVPNKALKLWANPPVDADKTNATTTSDDVLVGATSLGNADASFNFDGKNPAEAPPPVPRVDIQVGGKAEQNLGGALQQLAGYEGVGKGAAGGGISILYDVHALSYGTKNSESWVQVKWRHLVGKEDECKYK